ncbi:MAG: LysM peptidoglycan-binding domain-containing protein [Tepidisphaeraceae bacterium]
MTRETKIGLLVGMLFILVIGILLSDHFRGANEPPSATLDRAGATVRQTISSPGMNSAPPPIVITPDSINPRTALQTPRDLDPQPSPIVIAQGNAQNSNSQPGAVAGLPANDPLAQAARQQGQEIVPADPSGTGIAQNVAARSYQAQEGDTVSRMAAKLMGANTHANRQAIIAANPSLQADPNKVIVGQSYLIPGGSGAAPTAANIPGTVPVQANANAGWTYVVKPGDTLWGIATGQLGNANAIESIKQLNRDILHGGNNIQPGMKLRLPSQPVAIAE